MKRQFEVKGQRPETVNGARRAPHPIERRAGCPAAHTNKNAVRAPNAKATRSNADGNVAQTSLAAR
jgi:hypothetical protein